MNEQETKIASRDVFLVSLSLIINFLTIATLIFGAYFAVDAIRDGSRTHAAVCVYRADLVKQVKVSIDYLAAHPNGLPGLGISAAQIQATITRQQAAIESLSGLGCSD